MVNLRFAAHGKSRIPSEQVIGWETLILHMFEILFPHERSFFLQ